MCRYDDRDSDRKLGVIVVVAVRELIFVSIFRSVDRILCCLLLDLGDVEKAPVRPSSLAALVDEKTGNL